jgi:hypothetical protein
MSLIMFSVPEPSLLFDGCMLSAVEIDYFTRHNQIMVSLQSTLRFVCELKPAVADWEDICFHLFDLHLSGFRTFFRTTHTFTHTPSPAHYTTAQPPSHEIYLVSCVFFLFFFFFFFLLITNKIYLDMRILWPTYYNLRVVTLCNAQAQARVCDDHALTISHTQANVKLTNAHTSIPKL